MKKLIFISLLLILLTSCATGKLNQKNDQSLSTTNMNKVDKPKIDIGYVYFRIMTLPIEALVLSIYAIPGHNYPHN